MSGDRPRTPVHWWGAAAGTATAVVALLLSEADAPLLQLVRPFLALVAVQLIALSVPHLFAVRRETAGRPLLRAHGIAKAALPLAAVMAVATWLLAPCLTDFPLTHDHPVHIFQAWHFWTELIGRGRLKGWSHFGAFGYPAGELTPFAPDLWVAMFRVATLGLLDWGRTYAIALAGAVLCATAAVYAFMRRFLGVSAATIAALLWLLDPGAFCQGGWHWHMTYGVWPVTLGLGFTLLGLAKLHDLIAPERADRHSRDLLWAAFWICASLITHQLSIVILPIAVPLLMLTRAISREGLAPAAACRVAGGCALGLGLASFYVVPMLARSGGTVDLGGYGMPLEELGRKLVEFQVFENVWAPIVVLGFLGIVLALHRTSVRGSTLFMAAGAIVFLTLSSDILVSAFHVERLVKGILKVEAPRMLLVAKVFWFGLAAHAAVSLFRRSGGASTAGLPASGTRTFLRILLIAALGAPLARPLARHIHRTQVQKETQTSAQTPYWSDLQKLFEWSRAERLANHDFYRIAYALPFHDHLSTIAPVFDRTLYYKVGYTPAQQFSSYPMSAERELLEALSVKFFVADYTITDAAFIPERSFGKLNVYRFAGYRHDPFTLIGGGQGDLVQFDPELIRIRVRGSNAGSRLKLHVANYPRWEATQAGRVLPITQVSAYGAEYPILMEVPVGEGEVVFRYVRRGVDRAGLLLSALALLIAGLLAARVRPPTRFLHRAGWIAHVNKAAPWARRIVALGIIVVMTFAIWKLAIPPELPTSATPLFSPAADAMTLDGHRCSRAGPSAWDCGPHHLRSQVVSGTYGTHLCLHSSTAGVLVLTPTVQAGRFIEGRYDPAEGEGQIQVHADDRAIGTMLTRGFEHGFQSFQVDTRAWTGKTVRLKIEIRGAPLHCFELAIVR